MARYSNAHKWLKQKRRSPNLALFIQFSSTIRFSRTGCVKYRSLNVMRDADAISRVKPDELNADVLIADFIKNSIFTK